jgi:hypothetical protein
MGEETAKRTIWTQIKRVAFGPDSGSVATENIETEKPAPTKKRTDEP